VLALGKQLETTNDPMGNVNANFDDLNLYKTEKSRVYTYYQNRYIHQVTMEITQLYIEF